jgi:hydrogenase/urease accessory protein HupE
MNPRRLCACWAAALPAWLIASPALAHTGHGHDGLSWLQGLRHALGAPDHLLMLAFGFGLCSWAAPPVLRLARRVSIRVSRAARARWQAGTDRRNAGSAQPAPKA